ncbi:MAG: DUF2207 family protein, partial [Candidatus Caldipriscus sp.]
GTLVDEYADDRDIVATIIDLAIRGYLKIRPLGDKDVEIEVLREGDELEGYERKVFEAIKESAEDGKVLRLGENMNYFIIFLETSKASEYAEKYKKLHDTLKSIKDEVYDLLTKIGYFQENPDEVRKKYAFLGIGIAAIALITSLFLQHPYIGIANFFIMLIMSIALLPIFFISFGKKFLIIIINVPLLCAFMSFMSKIIDNPIIMNIFFIIILFTLFRIVPTRLTKTKYVYLYYYIALYISILFYMDMFDINKTEISVIISVLHHPSVEVPLGIALAGAIISFIGLHMPRKTEKGVEMYKRVLGFKEFIERVEEDRLKRMMEEDPTKIERIIPYAIVLGIENIWIEKIRKVINYIDLRDIVEVMEAMEAIKITISFISSPSKYLSTVPSHGTYSGGWGGFGGGGRDDESGFKSG